MKKAVLYARVSSAAQEKERTIESQIVALKKQIAAAGDVLVKEYLDDGFSGAKLDRPAMDQLRNDLKGDLFDAVYFLGTDRIARDVVYQNIIIGEILRHGKQLVVGGRDFAKSPENDFTLTVLGAASQLERAKIIERNTRGKMHCLRQGLIHSNGHNTFGYNYIPRSPGQVARSEINEKEAKVVRLIFQMYAEEGASWARIVRHLEDSEVLTRTGKRLWDTVKLRGILQNTSYMGIKYFNSRYNEKKSNDPLRKVKYGRKVYRDRSEWIPIKVPAIVSQKTFDKAQARLEASRNTYRRPKESRMLSGLVSCGECGRFFISYYRTYRDYRRKSDPKVVLHKYAYRCSRISQQRMHSKKVGFGWCKNPEVLAHLLESCVLSIMRHTLADPERLISKLNLPKDARASHFNLERRLEAMELRIVELGEQKKQLLDLYASGKITRAEYAERCRKRDHMIKKIKARRTVAIGRMPTLHMRNVVDEGVQQFSASVRRGLTGFKDDVSSRQFIKDHVEKVVYHDKKVTLIGSVPIGDGSSDADKIPFRIEGEIQRHMRRDPNAIVN